MPFWFRGRCQIISWLNFDSGAFVCDLILSHLSWVRSAWAVHISWFENKTEFTPVYQNQLSFLPSIVLYIAYLAALCLWLASHEKNYMIYSHVLFLCFPLLIQRKSNVFFPFLIRIEINSFQCDIQNHAPLKQLDSNITQIWLDNIDRITDNDDRRHDGIPLKHCLDPAPPRS